MGQLTEWGLKARVALMERGMTVKDLADVLGVKNPTNITAIFYDRKPGLKYRKKIEEYLGLDTASNE